MHKCSIRRQSIQITKERKPGRVRRALRHCANAAHRAWRWWRVAALVGPLMLAPAISGAGDAQAKAGGRREKVSATFSGGAYEKLASPFVGAGLSTGMPAGEFSLDASISILARTAPYPGSVELDEASVSVSHPLYGPLAVSWFACRSQYYGDAWELGAAFHITPAGRGGPVTGIHFAPRWSQGGTLRFR